MVTINWNQNMVSPIPTNEDIAQMLLQTANLLEIRNESSFRVRAFRRAAQVVENSEDSVGALARNDSHHLKDMPGIGEKIAGAIQEYVQSGKFGLLEHLKTEIAPEEVFRKVSGIGDELAHRIRETLEITTLEELEVAAHDGRLTTIPGVGKDRLEGIQQSLSGMLSRSARQRTKQLEEIQTKLNEGKLPQIPKEPDVALLLRVDEEYRQKAQSGQLRKIAPRRFNPSGEAWLPILNTNREGWKITALYSNTHRAHELDKVADWVVLYYKQDNFEDQCTVVTKQHGALKGKRIIRGREAECRKYYASVR